MSKDTCSRAKIRERKRATSDVQGNVGRSLPPRPPKGSSEYRSRTGTETIPNHSSQAPIIPRTCQGSFSAVSKPIFRSVYSFCNTFQNQQDLHTFAALQTQNFGEFSGSFFSNVLLNFAKISYFSSRFSHNNYLLELLDSQHSTLCYFQL